MLTRLKLILLFAAYAISGGSTIVVAQPGSLDFLRPERQTQQTNASDSQAPATQQTEVQTASNTDNIQAIRNTSPDRLDIPVLDLKPKALDLPFLEFVLRDPIRSRSYPKTKRQADRVIRQIENERENVRQANARAQKNLKRRIFEKLVDLSFYWGDIAYGRIQSEITASQGLVKLKDIHNEIIDEGNKYLRLPISRREKVPVTYQVALIEAQYPESFNRAIQKMIRMDRRLTNPERRKKYELLKAIYMGSSENQAKRQEGMVKLQRMNSSLSRRGSTVAQLAIARNLAGINWQGRRVWQTNLNYRNKLDLVSRLCQNLTEVEKDELLEFSVAVWTSASDFKGNWATMPFKLHCFRNSSNAAPVIERLALQMLKANKIQMSLKLYKEVYLLVKTPVARRSVEIRVSHILRKIYLEKNKPEAYQAFLIKVFNNSRGTVHGTQIAQMHYRLVSREMGIALKSKGVPLLKLRALFKRYLESHANDPATVNLKAKMAHILAEHGFEEQAVSEYKNLATLGTGAQRTLFATKALEIQSRKMLWKLDEPFANQYITDKENLQVLREIYLLKLSKSDARELNRWKDLLQLAIIEKNLQNDAETQKILKSILTKITLKPSLQKSFEQLVRYAYLQKDWNDMEKLVGFGRRKNLSSPANQIEGVTTLAQLYEFALQNQAEDAVASRNHKKAITNLRRVISIQAKGSSRNRNWFLMAQSYRSLEDYDQVINTLNSLLMDGVKDGLFEKALIEHANLNLSMARLEYAMRSYETLLASFPNSDQILDAKKVLADIYYVSGREEEARSLYIEIFAKMDTSNAAAEFIAKRAVLAANGSGNSAILQSTIEAINQKANNNIKLRSRVLAYLSKLVKLNSKEIASLNIPVATQTTDAQVFVVADLSSGLQFHNANANVKARFADINKAIVDSNPNLLDGISSLYRMTHEDFMQSCQPTYASYCVPALYSLANYANRFKNILADLSINENPQTLNKKLQLENLIREDIKSLKARAFELAQEGNTAPEWTSKILGVKHSKWQIKGKYDPLKMGFYDLPEVLNKKANLNLHGRFWDEN